MPLLSSLSSAAQCPCRIVQLLTLALCLSATPASAAVTLLVPSRPNIEKNAAAQARTESDSQDITEEVDVLVTMMQPFAYENLVMDIPQFFTVLRYDNATPSREGVLQPEQHNLLGDMEEIRYLGKKAWAANVALKKPGLYQFLIEARPWWDAARKYFVQHYVKTTLPVYGIERGWDVPAGQRFEIQPLTRPFGLTAPAFFSGRVLLNGQALPNASLRMARINTDKRGAPTPWHEELAAVTDTAGQFAFVLSLPGWWCCTALTPGAPLHGPDGEMRPLELGALFWLYVDSHASNKSRTQQ
ncbi:MAG: conserved hypothetical protein [Candidatus Desulfovibrio kirbyi]|uniref:DUF4198 domain-containing protein n=1 Tax=Candidatus Desulfovibrio kirbyi TaxID=2696086 RepID=A0A6L2R696_9BACT|nr:MAG: conserved hypothetical protein [Candidatus Desulfovibrio kirbyi]